MIVQVYGGLYISDIGGVRHEDTSQFDRVISVCQDECSDNVSCEYEHYPTSDDAEFDPDAIEDAIDAGVAARVRRETICVHCHAGVSRSAATCTGILAIVEGVSFDEALDTVRDAKHIQPKKEILDHVREYVNNIT